MKIDEDLSSEKGDAHQSQIISVIMNSTGTNARTSMDQEEWPTGEQQQKSMAQAKALRQ
jgi:hypothetical protein